MSGLYAAQYSKFEDAEGKVKEVYDRLMKTARTIPRPMRMMSTSPDLQAIQIFQAANHGADMIRHGTLFKAFKMAKD